MIEPKHTHIAPDHRDRPAAGETFPAACGTPLRYLNAVDGSGGIIERSFVNRFTGPLCPACAAATFGQLALALEVPA